MTATDELRRLLDERGVEWCDISDKNVLHTTWNDMNCWFNEFPDGWTAWGMAKRGTPEQAITATLGPGTCRQEERGWGTEGDHARVFLTCGHDCMVETVADLPNFCPACGARVVVDA